MGSIGVVGGHSWGMGEDTMFSCEIGDIEDEDDYMDFRYDCALVVYVADYGSEPIDDFAQQFDILGIDLEEITTLGLDTFTRGSGYYIINYWVEVPLGWGAGAAQVYDYADDIVEAVSNLNGIASLIFYPVLLAIPVANILFLRKRGK